MRFALLKDDGSGEVVNLVEAEQEAIDGFPDPTLFVPLEYTGEKHGGFAVSIGDVCVDVKGRIFKLGIAPTPTTPATLAVGDALYSVQASSAEPGKFVLVKV